MNATGYSADDVRAAWYARDLDSAIIHLYDGKLTPFQAIYEEEGQIFEGGVKDEHEEWSDQHQDWIIITETWDLSKPEDRQVLIDVHVKPNLARYERGKEVLKSCKLIESYRSTCLGDNAYNEMVRGETVVSPAIRVSAGYIATSEAEQWVALALQQGM